MTQIRWLLSPLREKQVSCNLNDSYCTVAMMANQRGRTQTEKHQLDRPQQSGCFQGTHLFYNQCEFGQRCLRLACGKYMINFAFFSIINSVTPKIVVVLKDHWSCQTLVDCLKDRGEIKGHLSIGRTHRVTAHWIKS